MNRQTKECWEMLKEGVHALTESTSYTEYLKFVSRFPTYSARNTLLIYQQKPDATFVAGLKSWNRLFGRSVKKGEKGIRILAPYTWKSREIDKDGQEIIQTRTGFRSITVFDYSQTQGRKMPEPPSPKLLDGEYSRLPEAAQICEKLTQYTVETTSLDADCNGQCQYETKKILLSESISPLHRFKTLLHESAHALLHDPGIPCTDGCSRLLKENRNLREVEAESVSFIVCSALGIDCSDFSFPYIALWKQNEEFLPDSMHRVLKTANLMIERLRT